jgi:hypothetical protein
MLQALISALLSFGLSLFPFLLSMPSFLSFGIFVFLSELTPQGFQSRNFGLELVNNIRIVKTLRTQENSKMVARGRKQKACLLK